MNRLPQTCPKCHSDITAALASEGFSCPTCGAAITPSAPDPTRERWATRRSRIIFRACFVTPTLLAAVTFFVGRANHSIASRSPGIGFVSFLCALIGSIYCGCWIAIRFSKPGGTRVLLAVLLSLALGFVNLVIVFAGYAPYMVVGR